MGKYILIKFVIGTIQNFQFKYTLIILWYIIIGFRNPPYYLSLISIFIYKWKL